jgi:hypothetical protein
MKINRDSTIQRISENINNENIKNNIKLLKTCIEPHKILTQSILTYKSIDNEIFDKNFIPLIKIFNLNLEEKENLILMALRHNVKNLLNITIKETLKANENFQFNHVKTRYLDILARNYISLDFFKKTKEIFNFKNEDLKVFTHLFEIKNPKICEEIYKDKIHYMVFVKNAEHLVKKIKVQEKMGYSPNSPEVKNLLEHINVLTKGYLNGYPSNESIELTITYFNGKTGGDNEKYDIISKTIQYNITKAILDKKPLEETIKTKKLKI